LSAPRAFEHEYGARFHSKRTLEYRPAGVGTQARHIVIAVAGAVIRFRVFPESGKLLRTGDTTAPGFPQAALLFLSARIR
jgi:hypothetical protein